MTTKPQYNKTQLDPASNFERHVYHRDQFAHYLRWTHVLKEIAPNATILDIGCGTANLLQVLYHNRHVPKFYLGVDVRTKTITNNVAEYSHLPWAHFRNLDFCQANVPTLGSFEYVVCFEVLEHLGKENGAQFIANIYKQLNKSTTLFISTPCYNGVDVADNHIINGQVGEYTYDEMQELLSEFFKIEAVWGTFASQKDYYDKLTLVEQKLFNTLCEYYDSNLVSVLFAPLVPKYSRNCLWVCKLK